MSNQESRSSVLGSPEYSRMVEGVERSVLESGYDSLRLIDKYAEWLGFIDTRRFGEYINGKEICDLGSGFDGFAFDCLLRKIDCEVTSVNPRRTLEQFNASRLKKYPIDQNRGLLGIGRNLYTDEMESLFGEIDKRAVAMFAHDLMGLEDGSFDLVLDLNAVFLYVEEEFEPVLQQSIGEMLRILRPGGRMRVCDADMILRPGGRLLDCYVDMVKGPEISQNCRWKMKLLDDMGLNYKLFDKKIGSGKGSGIGFEIVKE